MGFSIDDLRKTSLPLLVTYYEFQFKIFMIFTTYIFIFIKVGTTKPWVWHCYYSRHEHWVHPMFLNLVILYLISKLLKKRRLFVSMLSSIQHSDTYYFPEFLLLIVHFSTSFSYRKKTKPKHYIRFINSYLLIYFINLLYEPPKKLYVNMIQILSFLMFINT